MNGIVAGLQGCAAHLDVVIYSNTWRPCRVNQSCVQLWHGMLHCEKCMKCKCQSVHDQGEVGNISPVCSWSFPSLQQTWCSSWACWVSICTSHTSLRLTLRKRLLLLLMWVRPSSCRCMLGLFLCRLVMMESFIQSFWCFVSLRQ